MFEGDRARRRLLLVADVKSHLWLGVCIVPGLRYLPTAVQCSPGGKDKLLALSVLGDAAL